MPLKRNTKKNPFFMSSKKILLKYGLQDNHWVGHSAMKPVDDVAAEKRKSTRRIINDKSDKFEMEIIDEGVLDKALQVPEKDLDEPPSREKNS